MALIFLDGFDLAPVAGKWTATSNATLSTSYKRALGNGCRVGASDVDAYISKTTSNTESGCIVGAAFFITSPSSSFADSFFPHYEDVTRPWIDLRGGGVSQVKVCLNTLGKATVYNGNNELLGTTSHRIPTYVWNYVEVGAVCAATGSVVLRLGETEILSTTGATTVSGVGYVDTVVLRQALNSGTTTSYGVAIYYDDFYFLSQSGTNNDYWGDVYISSIAVSATGTNNEWSLTGAATKVSAVSSADTTSYVYSEVTGAVDTYVFGSLTQSGNVHACQELIYARKPYGKRGVSPIMYSGTQGSGSIATLNIDWTYHSLPLDVSADGSAWSTAKVAATEFGVEVEDI